MNQVEKVKIAEIRVRDTNTKYGPRKQVSIRQALDGGDRWLSGLINPAQYKPEEWGLGKVIELEVFERVQNDRSYWNFKVPSTRSFRPNPLFDEMNRKLDEVLNTLQEINQKLKDNNNSYKTLGLPG